MNITYHTMVGLASASVITNILPEENNINIYKICTIVIGINILLHGALDILPHTYSLSIIKDGLISLFLISIALFFINNKYKLITLCCIFGSILPDIIDKIIVKNIQALNTYIFPWHNADIINKFYSLYLKFLSIQYFWITNIIITILSLSIIIIYRDKFIKSFKFNH